MIESKKMIQKVGVTALSRPVHAYCSKGHRVQWYIHKPDQCPECKTRLLPVRRIGEKKILAH